MVRCERAGSLCVSWSARRWGGAASRAEPPPFALAFERIWSLDLWGSGIGQSGLLPVDLDRDGRLEIVYGTSLWGSFSPNRIWRIARFVPARGEYEILWSSPPTSVDILRLAVALIAGAPKVCVGLADGRLQVYDGATRALEREAQIADRALQAIVLADADNDGELELVVATESSVHLLDPDTLEPQSSFELGGQDMAVGNVDADLTQEIVLSSGPVVEFDGSQVHAQWNFSLFSAGIELGLSDLDGDGMQEIVSAQEYGTIDVLDADLELPKHRIPVVKHDSLLLFDVTGDGRDEILYGEGHEDSIHAVDAVSAQPLWQTPTGLAGVTSLAIADTDADGQLELLSGGGHSETGPNQLRVLDLASRSIEWQGGAQEGPLAALAQGDVDDDGREELVAISSESRGGYGDGVLHVFDAESLELEWRSETDLFGDSAGAIRDVAIGDVDRDGDTEIVVGAGGGFGEVFVLDGQSHALERAFAEFGRGTLQALTLADLDADGGLEIVTLELDRIRAIDGATGAEEWVSEDLNPRFPGGHAIEVADLDGDTWPEIVASLGHVVVVDGAQRSVRKTGFVEMRGIDLADYDGDGRKEIWAGSQQGNLMRIDPVTLEVEVLDDVCEGALNSVRLERATNLAGSVQFACDEGIGIYGSSSARCCGAATSTARTGARTTSRCWISASRRDACDRYPDDWDHYAARCEEAILNEALLSEALNRCEARPVFADADGDGEVDATDRCPSTPAVQSVDAGGCSHAQFCATFSGQGMLGMSICAASDWHNDEPLWRAEDCRVQLSSGFSWPIAFVCVTR